MKREKEIDFNYSQTEQYEVVIKVTTTLFIIRWIQLMSLSFFLFDERRRVREM